MKKQISCLKRSKSAHVPTIKRAASFSIFGHRALLFNARFLVAYGSQPLFSVLALEDVTGKPKSS
jgi:hypothetical protein